MSLTYNFRDELPKPREEKKEAPTPSRNGVFLSPDPEWQEPIPLRDSTAVSKFPADMFTPILADWIRATSQATQTPIDMAGMLLLPILGASVANRVRVVVRDGWTEPTNLFSIVALPPGERKSAVFSRAVKPILSFEQDELERVKPRVAMYESEKRILENRKNKLEKQAANAPNSSERAVIIESIRSLNDEIAALEVVSAPQFICDDCTSEMLVKLMAGNNGRILQAAAEGTSFEIAAGRYSGAANLDVYLKAHAGDMIRVSRVGRDSDTIDNPALSMSIAVQPDVIKSLSKTSQMRDRGFLARFLYSIPVSRVGHREIEPKPIDFATDDNYALLIRSLWNCDIPFERPALIELCPEANKAMIDFEKWLEPRLREGEELASFSGWANKLPGAVARIACLLSISSKTERFEDITLPIEAEHINNAANFARGYLISHARCAFGVLCEDDVVSDCESILGLFSQAIC